MTEEEAVSYYHSLLRFGIRPGLSRIRALCGELGNPQKRLRFVHVAGTNGKGSVCTEIASVLQCAGYKTGLYTSPYVLNFRERIRLDGKMIPPDDLADVTERVRTAVASLNRSGVEPTEFEAITAAAFLYYQQAGCDVVVLETGLGGRFDATNVVRNVVLCAVTSISLDHTAILGDTLEKIAFEKAGIIKPGVEIVTSPAQDPAALAVLQGVAAEKDAPLILSPGEDQFPVVAETITGSVVRYGGGDLRIPFPGAHQIRNTAVVASAVGVLRKKGFVITDAAFREGVARAFIPARTEVISRNPLVLLDGSHNEESTRALSEILKKHLYHKNILAVMGLMKDKDRDAVLANLLPCFRSVICVTPSNPRALRAAALAEEIRSRGVDAVAAEDPVAGVRRAVHDADRFDALVVCGSLYLAGDVREYLTDYYHADHSKELI